MGEGGGAPARDYFWKHSGRFGINTFRFGAVLLNHLLVFESTIFFPSQCALSSARTSLSFLPGRCVYLLLILYVVAAFFSAFHWLP